MRAEEVEKRFFVMSVKKLQRSTRFRYSANRLQHTLYAYTFHGENEEILMIIIILFFFFDRKNKSNYITELFFFYFIKHDSSNLNNIWVALQL